MIKKGWESICEKTQTLEFAKLENVDPDYYIEHQILTAVLKIFKVFRIEEKDLEALVIFPFQWKLYKADVPPLKSLKPFSPPHRRRRQLVPHQG